MNSFFLYQKFLNEQKKKRFLRNEELFLTFTEGIHLANDKENEDMINYLSATIGVVEDKPPRKERSRNRERETR